MKTKQLPKQKSPETIIQEKTSGNQHKALSNSSGPVTVSMTADACKALCAKANIEYKAGYEHRVLRYVASDESVDRAGDIIKQDGWDLTNFKKNPVIMGFHDYSSFPVGNALSVWVEDNKLKMDILFVDKDVNEDGDKAFRMAKSGFMRACSVGFNPIKYIIPTEDEIKNLGMGKYGVIFEKQELMETSVCGVPANANALQESISKGMFRKSELKGFVSEDILAEVEDVTTDEPAMSDEIKTYINEVFKSLETKAGAVLSKKNKELIESAVSAMAQASEALTTLLNKVDNNEEQEEEEEEEEEETSKDASIIDIDFDNIDDNSDDDSLYTEQYLDLEI